MKPVTKLALEAAGATHVGRGRSNNEDRYLLDADLGLYVVADGMGGHQAGEVASQVAVEAIHHALLEEHSGRRRAPPDQELRDALAAAHEAIRQAAQADTARLGMGSTAVVVWVPPSGNRAWIANVGDSRAYLWRAGQLQQLTEDHTLLNQALRAGRLPPDPEAWPSRHALSQALGASPLIAPSVGRHDLWTGDRLLLCSDGLTDMLADTDLAGLLAEEAPAQARCEALIRAANQRESRDNITVIVIRVTVPIGGSQAKPPKRAR